MSTQGIAAEAQNVEKIVHKVVMQIAEQKSSTVNEIKNEQRLVADLGFESLDLAQLVATLEMKLGVDPFVSQVSITGMRRVGDLVDAYSSCQENAERTAAAD